MDRFTLCLEDGLLQQLDKIAAERGYPSRSQAMADFIRRAIVKKEYKDGADCVGIIAVLYESGKKSPSLDIENILENNKASIKNAQTTFLKNGFILLNLSVVGKPKELQTLADTLRAVKGVTHGSFSIVSAL